MSYAELQTQERSTNYNIKGDKIHTKLFVGPHTRQFLYNLFTNFLKILILVRDPFGGAASVDRTHEGLRMASNPVFGRTIVTPSTTGYSFRETVDQHGILKL